MDRRAAKVQGDVLAKLRRLDRRLGGVRRGDVGPMEQRLLDLGGVKPLVMGGYGGVNGEWVELIDALAARAAPEQQHRLLCPSVQQCEGVLRVRMRTRLCFVGARARHVCMQDRLRKLRGDAQDAHDVGDGEDRAEARFRDARASVGWAGEGGRARR